MEGQQGGALVCQTASSHANCRTVRLAWSQALAQQSCMHALFVKAGLQLRVRAPHQHGAPHGGAGIVDQDVGAIGQVAQHLRGERRTRRPREQAGLALVLTPGSRSVLVVLLVVVVQAGSTVTAGRPCSDLSHVEDRATRPVGTRGSQAKSLRQRAPAPPPRRSTPGSSCPAAAGCSPAP